jgi:hypothetical protein
MNHESGIMNGTATAGGFTAEDAESAENGERAAIMNQKSRIMNGTATAGGPTVEDAEGAENGERHGWINGEQE